MFNLLNYLFTYIFIFSLLAIIRLGVSFFSSLLSNPPKPITLEKSEIIVYGAFLSYVITFLIYLL
jgi:hypothetical protein